ncbi:hypothetical protein [Sphingopyxis flava]|uniref:Uncharacterized protein n=1 Tax=Sphingopyxis flava TaxID=1507287 RepID=A0A1T5EN14_9SPHN|nr:hypothetical protein [Sphingopyxis flava]SKB85392.1 hypothetical protein SAMN06295937_102353 [Sphingopyxis flava]
MAKRKKALHEADGRGGKYSLIPKIVIDRLLVSVGPRAVAVALALIRRFNGYNNGAIALSTRELAEAIGSANHKANIAALHELERTGFVTLTARYPKGQRKANEYRLTFISYGPNGEHPATNEYLANLETDLETKKISASKTEARMAVRASETEARRKHRASEMEAGATETCGFQAPAPAVEMEAHILNHPERLNGSPSNTSAFASKSQAVASRGSACMDERELRDFALSYLAWAQPGAQSKLAHDVGVPGGTLSKFLNGRSLPEQYRMPLQLGVARSFPMEARNAA